MDNSVSPPSHWGLLTVLYTKIRNQLPTPLTPCPSKSTERGLVDRVNTDYALRVRAKVRPREDVLYPDLEDRPLFSGLDSW